MPPSYTKAPTYLEQLNEQIKLVEPVEETSVERYLVSGQNLLNQANKYRRAEDSVSVYIFLFRFANLMLHTIPKHPCFVKSDPRFLNYKKKLALEVMPELEKLKAEFHNKPAIEWPALQNRVSTDYRSGIYDGVKYNYKCFNDSWFGTYTCFVDKSFLDGRGKLLKTETFQLVGHTWYISFDNRKDGNLGAFLHPQSYSSVAVHCAFTLVNQQDAMRSKSFGYPSELSSSKVWGSSDLASIADIKNEASGFVKSGAFMVKLEIRMKLPENEDFNLCTLRVSGFLYWKLKNLNGKSPWCIKTEEFEIGGLKWRLKIHPYGQRHDGKHLSFHLRSCNDETVNASCTLTVVNHDFSEFNVSKKMEATFTPTHSTWGYPSFLKTDALENETLGFLENGWITLIANITVPYERRPKDFPITKPLPSSYKRYPESIFETGIAQAPVPTQKNICADTEIASEQRREQVTDYPEPNIDDLEAEFSMFVREATRGQHDHDMETMRRIPNAPLEALSELKDSLDSPCGHDVQGSRVSPGSGIGDPFDLLCNWTPSSPKDKNVASDGLDLAHNHDTPGNSVNPLSGINNPFECLSTLTEGVLFADRFLIQQERIQGKPHVLFAVDQISNNERVVLKFYASRALFENSKKLHPRLSSEYVCKMLHVIDRQDGYPPCLVFERSDDTLDKWMQRARRDLATQKAALFQILNCIFHLHSRNVIHCDIKPSNIAFFISTHTWKLLDTDIAVEKGQSCWIQYTPMYASPEMMRAETNGQTTIIPETSIDMWAFGILAYEVWTGNRFYGLSATKDTVKDCLCGRRELPSLESIEEAAARRLISSLLCRKPEDRWSAQRALNHAVFKCGEDTTQRARGMQQVGSQLNRILRIVQSTANEVQSANLMVVILLEGFLSRADASFPFHLRSATDVPTMSDDYLENKDPIFLLNQKRDYRMRVSLKHRYLSQMSFQKIKSISLIPPDGPRSDLCIQEVPSESGEHEVVALFSPERCGSKRLKNVSPSFGNPQRKYIKLDVVIKLETGGIDSLEFELRGEVYCKIVAKNKKLMLRRFAMGTADRWRNAPQWVRDGARGAIIFAKELAQVM